MATLKFNKVHKNGWVSYKQVGTAGAVFIDKRMLSAETLATPPETIEFDSLPLVALGADASVKSAEELAKKQAREEAKAAKAAVSAQKAQARAEKAAAALAKAQAIVDKAKAAAPVVEGEQAPQ